MANKKLIMLIAGAQLQGIGTTLKSLDGDNAGSDDLAGNLCKAAGQALVAAGSDNLTNIRKALELNIQISQEYLNDNPA